MFSVPVDKSIEINPRIGKTCFSNSKLMGNGDNATQDGEIPMAMIHAKESRRLANLFGSKSHGCCARKKKKGKKTNERDITLSSLKKDVNLVKENKEKIQNQNSTSVDRLSQPKYISKKFTHRTKKERCGTCLEDIHADNNLQIENPWFVGYRNSASLPSGSLLSIAKRYGSTSAIKLSKQCSDRVSTTPLEKANETSEENFNKNNFFKSDLLCINKWEPPLIAAPHGVTVGKLGGGGHFASSPKLWPRATKNHTTKKAAKGERELHPDSFQNRPRLKKKNHERQESFSNKYYKKQVKAYSDNENYNRIPLKLSRVIDREAKIWKQVAEEAERERRNSTSSRKKRLTQNMNRNEQQVSRVHRNRQIKNHVYNNKIVSFENNSVATSQHFRFHRMGLSPHYSKSKIKVFILS